MLAQPHGAQGDRPHPLDDDRGVTPKVSTFFAVRTG